MTISQLGYYTGLGLPTDLALDLVAADQQLQLPQRLPIPYDTDEATGWAGHYGGSLELYRHAKGIKGLFPGFNATWQHGIIESWRYKQYPLQLLSGIKHPPDRLIFVATKSQQYALRGIGYRNVHAIGSPFAYAKPRVMPRRIGGSMLYMPSHSIDGETPNRSNHNLEYCRFLESEGCSRGSKMYVSLHMACLRNRSLWPTLRRKGIPIVAGADYCDGHSYRRMWHLFHMFETVCTNALGSHIFYALAAGCRVLFNGPRNDLTEAALASDSSFRRAILNGENFLKDQQWQSKTDSFLQSLFNGVFNVKLGESTIGLANIKSPSKIRQLLGWRYCDQMHQIPFAMHRVSARLLSP